MKPFRRRRYHRFREILADIRRIIARRKDIAPLLRGESLERTFRERLMVVVTEVNACRYCAYYHARQALVEGITPEELAALTAGEFAESPLDERTALLYAQHFAEADGDPEPTARNRLVATYGVEQASNIELALQVIRTANLLGNTLDYLLHRLRARKRLSSRRRTLGD